MGCLRLTYNTNLDLVKNEFKRELTPNFSTNKEQSAYFYGFNGMERDDAIKGKGNSYTTKFRQYDPRVGRWLSIDPKMKAWESPYVGYSDNPIWFRDPSGADTTDSNTGNGDKDMGFKSGIGTGKNPYPLKEVKIVYDKSKKSLHGDDNISPEQRNADVLDRSNYSNPDDLPNLPNTPLVKIKPDIHFYGNRLLSNQATKANSWGINGYVMGTMDMSIIQRLMPSTDGTDLLNFFNSIFPEYRHHSSNSSTGDKEVGIGSDTVKIPTSSGQAFEIDSIYLNPITRNRRSSVDHYAVTPRGEDTVIILKSSIKKGRHKIQVPQ